MQKIDISHDNLFFFLRALKNRMIITIIFAMFLSVGYRIPANHFFVALDILPFSYLFAAVLAVISSFILNQIFDNLNMSYSRYVFIGLLAGFCSYLVLNCLSYMLALVGVIHGIISNHVYATQASNSFALAGGQNSGVSGFPVESLLSPKLPSFNMESNGSNSANQTETKLSKATRRAEAELEKSPLEKNSNNLFASLLNQMVRNSKEKTGLFTAYFNPENNIELIDHIQGQYNKSDVFVFQKWVDARNGSVSYMFLYREEKLSLARNIFKDLKVNKKTDYDPTLAKHCNRHLKFLIDGRLKDAWIKTGNIPPCPSNTLRPAICDANLFEKNRMYSFAQLSYILKYNRRP